MKYIYIYIYFFLSKMRVITNYTLCNILSIVPNLNLSTIMTNKQWIVLLRFFFYMNWKILNKLINFFFKTIRNLVSLKKIVKKRRNLVSFSQIKFWVELFSKKKKKKKSLDVWL